MSNRHTFAQQCCIKKAGLALQKASPLKAGDRIGVAVSGGVDSLVLLQVLLLRQRIVPFKTEIMALHCNPGFDPGAHFQLRDLLASLGVAAHFETDDFGPLAHSPVNRKKSPCFLCSWQRRKRLFALCEKYSLSHLALGHNAEDLASTFFLNLFRNGSAKTISIKEEFFSGKLSVIRPLLLVEKKYIRQAARQWRLPVQKNPCPTSGYSARAEMESLMAWLDTALPGAKKSAINGLCRAALANAAESCQDKPES